MSSPQRRRLGLGILVAFLLVLTGCVRIDMDLTIHEDETADAQADFFFPDATSRDEVEALCLDDAMTGGTASDVEIIEEGGDYGCRVAEQGLSFQELTDESMSVAREGDEFVFTMEPVEELEEDLGDMPPGMEEPEVSISVTFPGEIIEPSDRKSTRLNSSHVAISYA